MPASDGQRQAHDDNSVFDSAMSSREALAAPFHFGPWLVDPAVRVLRNGGESRQVEPLAMDVLVALCLRAGEVVSTEELLQQCWGTTLHGDNPVHKIITQLRKALGDSTAEPVYIATIRKRGYQTVATVVHGDGRIPATRPGAWGEGSPFRGLEAFDERHAGIFHGRREATSQLKRAVLAQVRAGNALQWVLGPSGSGKTSLVQAGLIPALMVDAGSDPVSIAAAAILDMGDVDEATLYTALASSLIDWEIGGCPLFPDISADDLGKRLAEDHQGVLTEAFAALPAKTGSLTPRYVLLFLDRFEALFAGGAHARSDESAPMRFVQLLETFACQPGVIVVAACRNDFYPQLAALPAFMAAKSRGGQFDLMPPTAAEMAQMIRTPALAAGLRFGVDAQSGTRLDDVLCASAAKSSDALPLLQYTLQELYRQRTDDNELSATVFEKLGGLEGAIGQRAEEVASTLAAPQQAALPEVLSLIVTISADGDSVTSRGAALADLPNNHARELVFALIEARLVVSRLHNGVPGFAVAHEALLRRWPRISEWIEQHREELRVRARVSAQTTRWMAEGRNQELLLSRGKQAEEAMALLRSGAVALSRDEKALIVASARRAAFSEKLRISVIAALVILALLATVLGINAANARRQAEQRRTEAEGLMGYMLNDFADKMRPLGRLELLDGISAKAMSYLSDGGNETLGPVALTQRAKALQVIGEVRVQRGDTNGAQQALLTAHEILQRQAIEQPANTEVLKNKGVNAYWLGKIHKDRSQFGDAERYYRQYLEAADKLNQIEPDNPEWWIEQSYGHNNLGGLARTQGDYKKARTELAQSLALKVRALEKRPDDRNTKSELADTYSWLSGVELAEGRLSEAQKNLEGGIGVIDRLQQRFPSEAVLQYRLAGLKARIAAVQLAMGETDASLNSQNAAIAVFAQLNRIDPQNREWQRLYYAHQSIGYFFSAQAGHPTNVARIQELAKKIDALVRVDPQRTEWIYLAATVRRSYAMSLRQAGRLAEARRELQQALYLLKEVKQPAANQETFVVLPRMLMLLAEIEQQAGNASAADSACRTASGLLANQVADSFNYELLDTWVRAQICLDQRPNANDSIAKLDEMGYRNADFRLFLSRRH